MISLAVERARLELLRLKGTEPGWGYHPGSEPYVESTVLCCLGLLSVDQSAETLAVARQASEWLAFLQQSDGSLGLSASLSTPNWTTSYAILLWATDEKFRLPRARAANWLIRQRGSTFPRDSKGVLKHDPSIPGWPWVAATHSWVEPTSMAIMAMRRHGLRNHERVRDGLRLIRDRSVAAGGWNYGNSAIYGTDLRPLVIPTGMALLALAGSQEKDSTVARAIEYLSQALPQIRSPQSLCWGLLGLSAWGIRPADASNWIKSSFQIVSSLRDVSYQMAHLLLAVGEGSLAVFGVNPSAVPAQSGSIDLEPSPKPA